MRPNEQETEFPLRMALTTEGVTYFIQKNIPFEKMVLADGSVEHGVLWSKFHPGLLKQFLLSDSISRIELARTEFNSKRAVIIDLGKLLFYGMLYKQMDSEFFKKMLDSEVVKKWNRQNTPDILDENSRFDKKFTDRISRQKQLELKKVILSPLASKINKDEQLEKEGKTRKIQIIEKFLSNMSGAVWFMLTEFEQDAGYLSLLGELRNQLSKYLEKTNSAMDLAITLMELLNDAEKRNIQKFVTKHFGEKKKIDQLLYNEATRRKVFSSMEALKAYVFLSWKISPGALGQRSKLQIYLYDNESDYHAVSQLVEENKMASTQKMSLVDFYTQGEEQETSMGLHYLSLFDEACRKVDMRFDSIVNQIKTRDMTVITLTLLL